MREANLLQWVKEKPDEAVARIDQLMSCLIMIRDRDLTTYQIKMTADLALVGASADSLMEYMDAQQTPEKPEASAHMILAGCEVMDMRPSEVRAIWNAMIEVKMKENSAE